MKIRNRGPGGNGKEAPIMPDWYRSIDIGHITDMTEENIQYNSRLHRLAEIRFIPRAR